MFRLTLALMATSAWGCTTPTRPPVSRAAERPPAHHETLRKAAAPVAIDATVGQLGALVHVNFARAASDVSVRLAGAHGLAVAEARVQPIGSVAAGPIDVLRVGFAPDSEGELVVTVRGVFDGVVQQRVASFRVGGLRGMGDAAAYQGPDGRALLALPAQRR